LMILRSRNKVKAKELAERLNVSTRTISDYKKDFYDELDIWIESNSGKYGGYYIYKDNSILNLGVNKEEFTILNSAKSYLKEEGFIFSKEYEVILDKINSNLKSENGVQDIGNSLFQSTPNIDIEEEKNKYLLIDKAKVNSKKIKMSYRSLSSGFKERVVHPYLLYNYQGSWYFLGFCELRDEPRQFKLSRIKDIRILKEVFEPIEVSSIKKKLANCLGLYFDENKTKVKLEIDFPMSIKISERTWVRKQKITFQDDESIIFEAEMIGMKDIVNWVLSMGSSVRVIEPEILKEKVKEEARKILEKN